MLGQHMRQQRELPPISIASTKVVEALKEHWIEERGAANVTLDKNDPIWKEWWIGASGVHKVCPRMFALMASQQEKADAPKVMFRSETLWNFDQGHAYHDLMQQKALASFPDGVMLGRWKRWVQIDEDDTSKFKREVVGFENKVPDGVSLERGWGPRPAGDGWEYDEPKLRIPGYRAVVKIDAIFDWPDEGLEVVEIKTEKLDAKDDLNPKFGGRPRSQHIEQAHIGMWATGIQKARIIYIFKGDRSLASGMIEHLVNRDESIIEEIQDRFRSCILAVAAIDRIRDDQTALVCDENTVAFKDLESEAMESVRLVMRAAAEEMPRLTECQMKSKGKPKFCDGRDLCFGVRKRKKKAG